MTRIDIKLFDLPFEKRAETLECFVEINEKYLRYKAEYYSQQARNKEDLAMGWDDCYNNWDIKIKRDAFISVEKFWDNKNNYWRLELEANGYPNVIILYYEQENEDELHRVFNLLSNFVF
jgi:hypothetical protein